MINCTHSCCLTPFSPIYKRTAIGLGRLTHPCPFFRALKYPDPYRRITGEGGGARKSRRPSRRVFSVLHQRLIRRSGPCRACFTGCTRHHSITFIEPSYPPSHPAPPSQNPLACLASVFQTANLQSNKTSWRARGCPGAWTCARRIAKGRNCRHWRSRSR